MSIFARIMAHDIENYYHLMRLVPVNAKDDNGVSLLRLAIAYGSEPIAVDLVDRGIEIDQPDENGRTEIQNAFAKGFWETGRRLVSRGASLTHRDHFGNNALWYAAMHPRPDYELIKLLVDHGSDVGTKNIAGRSPMDGAKERSRDKLIEIFMSASG